MSSVSSVQVGVAEQIVWVRVDGRGSFQNSTALKEFATEMTRRGHREFIIDLEDCELMDSTFMGTLAGIALQVGDGGQVRIIHANRRNRDVLTNLGLDRIMNLEDEGPSTPTKAMRDAESHPPQEAARETIIKAHQNLIEANPRNAVRFKDVIEFLKGKEPEQQSHS